jgi:hypothetical protein
MGIMFSLKKIRELLKANKKHAKIIWNDFECVCHPSKFGMDTAVRDIWFDLVARHYVRRDWPKGSEKKTKASRFFKNLYKALDKDKVKYK